MDPIKIDILENLAVLADQAEDNFQTEFKRLFPLGEVVVWMVNGHAYQGPVIAYHYGRRMRVRNEQTDRHRTISMGEVLRAG